MKKYTILVILVLCISTIYAEELIHEFLPNGMEVCVKENRQNTSVGFFCFVKTGSVNEGKYLGAGISHYLEHVVAGGSTKLHTESEYEEMGKQMGAIVNAYTSTNVTAFYIIVDKKYKEQALNILAEQMQFCIFDSTEVQREKGVILKEIVLRSTPPPAKIYQKYRELMYPNSNKKYPIIGFTKLFKKITKEELEDYYHKRYLPNNMIFVAVGDFIAEDIFNKIEKTFEDFQRNQIEPVYLPQQNIRNGSLRFIQEFNIKQSTSFISYILPAADYEDGLALWVALEIFFGKRKSPIKYKLVEELKLVNNIFGFTQYPSYSPEGNITIYYESKETSDVDKILGIIDDELEKYSKSGITQEDIEEVINSYKSYELLSTPGVKEECNRIGHSLMMYGKPDVYSERISKMEKLIKDDIKDVLKKYLLNENRIVFHAIPEGEKFKIEQFEEKIAEKTEPEKYILDDNLTLIYRKSTVKPVISGYIFFPLSTNYETVENVGSLYFMEKIMFKGSKNYDPLYISEWIENHSAQIKIYINNIGTYIKFKCLKKDFSELEEIMIDVLDNPTFPESEISLAKQRKKANYKRSLSDAYSIHKEFRDSVLYQGQRAGVPLDKKLAIIEELTRKDLERLYKDYLRADYAIFTFQGDLTLTEAKKYTKEIFKEISHKKIRQEMTYLEVPDLGKKFINQYEFEQVRIDLNFTAPTIDSKDFNTMKVINLILNGSRGRLHQAVRGENNLAYFAYADYVHSKHYGFIRFSTQTSIDKKDSLLLVLEEEIDKLKNELVDSTEINSAIEEHKKILKSYLNDNVLPYYLTYYESIGLGYDYFDTSTKALKQVTNQDIKRVANKYFENATIIISEPTENVELMVE